MSAQATSLLKRLSQLKAERLPYEQNWKQAYKYGCPERQQSFQDSTNIGLEQERKQARSELFDSTACESIQLLVSSIYSGTTNPTSKWFQAIPSGLGSPTRLTNGEIWLEEVTDFMFRNIHSSNFDSIISDFLTDLVVARMGCTLCRY